MVQTRDTSFPTKEELKEPETDFKVRVILRSMLEKPKLCRLDEDREDRWGLSSFCNSKHDDKLELKQCWN